MVLFVCLLVLFSPLVAMASNFICGDSTRLEKYTQGVDPALVPVCPGPYLLSGPLLEDVIPAQDALFASVNPQYIKVVSGLMVEMTAQEKINVDAPRVAQEALRAEFTTELRTQDICSSANKALIQAKIATLRNNMRADINNITNINSAVTELLDYTDKLTNALEKLAICAVGVSTLSGVKARVGP